MIRPRHAALPVRHMLTTGAAALALATSGCGWLFRDQQQANTSRRPNGGGNMVVPLPPSRFPPMTPQATPGQLQPGQYEFRVRNDLLSANGFPDEVVDRLRQQLSASSNTTQRCVSPQEAQSSDYGLGQGLRSANCDPSGLRNTGGRLSGQVACNFNGVPATGTINGLVTRDSVFFQLTVSAQPPGDTMHSLQLRSEVNASRIANCATGGGFPSGPGGGFPPPRGGMAPPPGVPGK